MYNGYITYIKNLRPHPNADRLQLGECFGNTICVSLDYTEDTLGVYFPTDGQLSEEFCRENVLVRRKDENGNPSGGYMDPDKRNIKAIKLRGEKSDGLFLPISCFDYCFGHHDASIELKVGDIIGILNGHEICCKYIPRSNRRPNISYGSGKMKVHKKNIAPLFMEHVDTEQLAYNLSAFKPGDQIEISLKMHGTSQRTARLPMIQGYKDSFPCRVGNAIKTILNKLSRKNIYQLTHDGEPIYEYGYVSGTRRTVLENYEGGFYGDNAFRQQHHDAFVGKLNRGETVYYEVVGFTNSGAPIMSIGKNDKLGKEFVKMYGKETVFSYGCALDGIKTVYEMDEEGQYAIKKELPKSDIYVYRMTITNEDGFVVEYTPDFMRYRCEQMGVKCVPVFWKGFIPEYPAIPAPNYLHSDKFVSDKMIECDAGEYVKHIAEIFYGDADPIGATHIREGVVVRIINRPRFSAYKHKNFEFKVLEGLIKEIAEAPDMEEAEAIVE